MRFVLAGLIFLLCSTFALAEVTGEVESIGFNNTYRPDCFTPMIIKINPHGIASGKYFIQVKQTDIDGDEPTFTRPISITSSENSRDEQRFAMYFLPKPRDLPDTRSGATLRDLQKELKVFLCAENGKQIANLPVTNTITNLDPPRAFGNSRGTKLVLAVCGNGSMPWISEYSDPALLGVLEDVVFIQMPPRALPENPVSYDSVDAVVWMNVDPGELKRGGDEKFRALETWIKTGGQLVICQSPQWQQYLDFGDLLPVTIQSVDATDKLEPLKSMANPKPWSNLNYKNSSGGRPDASHINPWDRMVGPYQIARATAKPSTVVDEWVTWDEAKKDLTPFIVRQLHGLGAVTWVAQDLGSQALRANSGWMNVWDRVFDWKNTPVIGNDFISSGEKDKWTRGGYVDLGPGLVGNQLELSGTVSALVAVAVAFFIVYWVIAGPGIFAYLVNKRRQNLSWFGFAVSAIVATFVTVLIVKLIVRGPPQISPLSIIEQTPGQPDLVRARFGLYIKQDGDQRIQLKDNDPNFITTLTALPKHPEYLKNSDVDSTSAVEYTVPVREFATDDPPAITVPYRSTLKKFDATWYGKSGGRIEGMPKLIGRPEMIDGMLTNATGKKLEQVYFAFKYPADEADPLSRDWVLWLPTWDAGQTLDLRRVFNQDDAGRTTPMLNVQKGVRPGGQGIDKVKGFFKTWQDDLWTPALRSRVGSMGSDGRIDDVGDAWVMLSLFDRFHPIENQGTDTDRVDVLRRGGRHLDRSSALAAGGLVIVGQVKGAPLPVPLEVQGDPVTGDGPIYFQEVLPINREAVNAAATQSSAEAK